MKLFICYKGEDYDRVVQTMNTLRDISPDIQISIIRNAKNWKSLSKSHITKADYVIYLAGKTYSDNIDWEIDTAIKYGHKVRCVKLYDDVQLTDSRLFKQDTFDKSKQTLKIEEPITMDQLVNLIKGDSAYLTKKLFESGVEDNNLLVEQYKVLLSTSESLIERRQKLTTTYLSIFSVMLPVLSAMLTFEQAFLQLGAFFVSAICIILCLSWRGTIISYGKSNLAKFAILEEMEKQLPVAMFASEWLVLNRITTRYKSFTNRETTIPVIFIAIYTIFAVLSLVLFIINIV
ncbi:MAG: hypothetical protein IJ032_06215 [Clostridia bacterium]|nr:hypothetical protein [Clostridia bacterium]